MLLVLLATAVFALPTAPTMPLTAGKGGAFRVWDFKKSALCTPCLNGLNAGTASTTACFPTSGDDEIKTIEEHGSIEFKLYSESPETNFPTPSGKTFPSDGVCVRAIASDKASGGGITFKGYAISSYSCDVSTALEGFTWTKTASFCEDGDLYQFPPTDDTTCVIRYQHRILGDCTEFDANAWYDKYIGVETCYVEADWESTIPAWKYDSMKVSGSSSLVSGIKYDTVDCTGSASIDSCAAPDGQCHAEKVYGDTYTSSKFTDEFSCAANAWSGNDGKCFSSSSMLSIFFALIVAAFAF